MMKQLSFVFLIVALFSVGSASAVDYAVNAFARYDLYVSDVDYNGVPVGNDITGNASLTNPLRTIDKALTLLLPGSRVILNGNPASPTVYVTTTGLVAGRYTLMSREDYGAKVAGSGTTQALSAVSGGRITLSKIIIDPSENVGGPAAVALTIPGSALAPDQMEITLDAPKFQGWTTQAVNAAGTTRANITSNGSIFIGGNVNGAYFINGFAAGTFTRSDDVCTLTAQNLASVGGCIIVIASTGGTATVVDTGSIDSCTLDPALTGVGLHYCRRFNDIVSTTSGGSSSILGAPGARTGSAISLTHATNSITGSSISNLATFNTTNGGYGWAVGNESVTAAPLSTVTITNVSSTGNAVSGAGNNHCGFIGANIENSVADGGTMTTCGLPLVNKLGSGNTFRNFTIYGWYGTAAVYMKGATNPVATGNSATQNIATGSTKGIDLGDDTPGSGAHTTGAVVTGNTIINQAGTNFAFFGVDVANTFAGGSPANNTYEDAGGAYNANRFQMGDQGDFTTCSAYKAAVEPSATCLP